MLRVRLDGGALTLRQLRVLADISHDFARGTADISDRQNIQYHWIRVEDVPEIWRRLEEVGLQTTEACGDTPRVVLGSPLAGIAADEIIDPTPTIDEITRRFVGDPELANLPRKFKSAITGHPSLDVVHEINDISLVGVVHPELGRRLRPLGRRRAVHGPAPGRADRRLRRAGAGRRRVARRHLDLPRLRLPPAAHQGSPEVPHGRVGRREVPRGARDRVPRPPRCPTALPRRPRPAPATTSASTCRRTATTTSGPPRSSAGSAATCSPGSPTCMETAGTDRVRLTPHQKLVVLDVAPGRRRRPRRRPRGRRPVGVPQPVPPPHDGLHRHRVLQARHRRDQGHGRHRDRRARAPPRRRHRPARHPGHPQRQRLPQLVRPHPGRRHRPQGHDRHHRRRAGPRASRCTSAAASRRRPRRGRPGPHRARA